MPLGQAAVASEGGYATIVAWGPALQDALKAAEELAGEGIECDVIDVRTLVPLDMEPAGLGREDRALCGRLPGDPHRQLRHGSWPASWPRPSMTSTPGRPHRAANGISPQAEGLEAAFLPNAGDIAAAVKGLSDGQPIRMPMPGQMTEECTVLQWYKAEGDTVYKGDPLFEIETDKSNMEIEAFDEGTLLHIDAPEGATVPVEAIVAWIGQPGDELPEPDGRGGSPGGGWHRAGSRPALRPRLPPGSVCPEPPAARGRACRRLAASGGQAKISPGPAASRASSGSTRAR